jgi:hypothetical protein
MTPPRMPPPASQAQKPCGWWSRPSPWAPREQELHLFFLGVSEINASAGNAQSLVVVDVRATHGQIELADQVEEAVAHHFGFHAAVRHSPVILVVAIAGAAGGVAAGAQAVGGARGQKPVELLHAPAFVHEAPGEIIEERRLGRHRAIAAEVEGARHQGGAEMPQPHVVDRHPRRQGILLVGQPARECQAAASAGLRKRLERSFRIGSARRRFPVRRRLRQELLGLCELLGQLGALLLDTAARAARAPVRRRRASSNATWR